MRNLFLFLLITTFNCADKRNVELLSKSVVKVLGFKMDRFNTVAGKIKFGTPSLAKQWGIINSFAEATYNDKLNILEIKKESMVREGFMKGRAKTIFELKAADPTSYTIKLDTFFHEMAHAEMDVMIEEKETAADKKLYEIMVKEVKPWFKKHFKRINSKIAFWEVHGYYVGQIIEVIFADMSDIALQNGINTYSNKAFKGFLTKTMVDQLSKEEYCQYLMPEKFGDKLDALYRDRLKVNTVWVGGKTVDISSVKKDPFKMRWYQAIWDQFAANFDPPKNMRELTDRMNNYHFNLRTLKNYRAKFWDESHQEQPTKIAMEKENDIGFGDIVVD